MWEKTFTEVSPDFTRYKNSFNIPNEKERDGAFCSSSMTLLCVCFSFFPLEKENTLIQLIGHSAVLPS